MHRKHRMRSRAWFGAGAVFFGMAVAFLVCRVPQATAGLPGGEARPLDVLVEIDGIPASTGVIGVDGFESCIETIVFREGGNPIADLLPAGTVPPEITLTVVPGVMAQELWEWHVKIRAGGVDRRNMAIVFIDAERREEVGRYLIESAWPSKWAGFRVVAAGAVIPTERVTLACRTVSRGEVRLP